MEITTDRIRRGYLSDELQRDISRFKNEEYEDIEKQHTCDDIIDFLREMSTLVERLYEVYYPEKSKEEAGGLAHKYKSIEMSFENIVYGTEMGYKLDDLENIHKSSDIEDIVDNLDTMYNTVRGIANDL